VAVGEVGDLLADSLAAIARDGLPELATAVRQRGQGL
jgi:hypothetical protein